MKYGICLLCLIAVISVVKMAWAEAASPRVRLETSQGIIILELNAEAAPKTVENFLSYVRDGFFDNTIFHRVIKGFMVQGGGLTADLKKKQTRPPVENEADNGLHNLRGTIAMARTNDPHSATAQFFINTADNDFLDHTAKTSRGWGYCVFGKVVEGMDIVETIEKTKTTSNAGRDDVPVEPIVIQNATIIEE